MSYPEKTAEEWWATLGEADRDVPSKEAAAAFKCWYAKPANRCAYETLAAKRRQPRQWHIEVELRESQFPELQAAFTVWIAKPGNREAYEAAREAHARHVARMEKARRRKRPPRVLRELRETLDRVRRIDLALKAPRPPGPTH